MTAKLLQFGVQFGDGTVRASAKWATRAIFGYGSGANFGQYYSMTNLVNNYGGVATDTTGVGTVRTALACASFGIDRATFAFGSNSPYNTSYLNISNTVSNTGVVSNDNTGIGTARASLAAAGYGGDKAIFGYGFIGNVSPNYFAMTNLLSNIGVMATDTSGVGTVRSGLAAASYGGDKAIFGYGQLNGSGTGTAITNLVSNTGVVSTDTTGVGTLRYSLAATSYGGDKAVFGYGNNINNYYSMTNLVSNTGVVSTDVTGVGTTRIGPAAAGYGGDKALFGYGYLGGTGLISATNKVSNIGVVGSDITGIGTARNSLAAASYSS